jgi:hypothetical protein
MHEYSVTLTFWLSSRRIIRWGVYALAAAILWHMGVVYGLMDEIHTTVEDLYKPEYAPVTWILVGVGILFLVIGLTVRSRELRSRAQFARSWRGIRRAIPPGSGEQV